MRQVARSTCTSSLSLFRYIWVLIKHHTTVWWPTSRLTLSVTSLALLDFLCVIVCGWCSNHVHIQSYSLDVAGHKIHCCGLRVEYLCCKETDMKNKCIVKNALFFLNVIRESSAIKSALTNAA